MKIGDKVTIWTHGGHEFCGTVSLYTDRWIWIFYVGEKTFPSGCPKTTIIKIRFDSMVAYSVEVKQDE